MSQHKCPVSGCTATCAPAKLMCWKHWRLVPPEMQRAVYRTYRAYYATPILPSERFSQADRARIDAAAAAIKAAGEATR